MSGGCRVRYDRAEHLHAESLIGCRAAKPARESFPRRLEHAREVKGLAAVELGMELVVGCPNDGIVAVAFDRGILVDAELPRRAGPRVSCGIDWSRIESACVHA